MGSPVAGIALGVRGDGVGWVVKDERRCVMRSMLTWTILATASLLLAPIHAGAIKVR